MRNEIGMTSVKNTETFPLVGGEVPEPTPFWREHWGIIASAGILVAVGGFVVLLLLVISPVGGDDDGPPLGAVSSSCPYATEAGIEILKRGGNGADAVVAVQAVLTLTEPYGSGIGGGMFILMRNGASREFEAYDGREEAPEALEEYPEPRVGGAPSGTPGTVAALVRLHEEHGAMDFADCLAPAIKLAREGWVLSPHKAGIIANAADNLRRWNSTAKLYLLEDGSPPPAGHVMLNPDYANTLEAIAANWRVFYEGDIAQDIVDTVRNDHLFPGVLAMSDLQNYRAVKRQPTVTTFKGIDVIGMPSPSSGGGTAALILNILEVFGAGTDRATVDSVHGILDAMSLAYADRAAYYGDADFAEVPEAGFRDKTYASARAQLINLTSALNEVEAGTPPGAPARIPSRNLNLHMSNHTTHYSVADSEGSVFAVTSTIEATWGSQVVVPGRGFLLNNELNDFSLCEGGGADCPNAAVGGRSARRTALGGDADSEGGKRPLSSMTPSLLMSDGVVALGSPGGSRIICTVVNVILNVLEFDMSLQAAIDYARIYSRNTGFWELEEPLFSNAGLKAEMALRGFDDIRNATSAGSVNMVALSGESAVAGAFSAAADSRRDGTAIVLNG